MVTPGTAGRPGRPGTAGFAVAEGAGATRRLARIVAPLMSRVACSRTKLPEFALTVEDAVREADVAVDFVPDELESKLEIFSMIDRMAPPKTILCTPSDALSITDLASCVYRPERCVAVRGNLLRGEAAEVPVARLLYPASVAESTLTAVEKFLRALGVEVRRETDPEVPLLMKNAVE